MKRKFKEALEKNERDHRDEIGTPDGESAVHAVSAPQTRREFRRKSG